MSLNGYALNRAALNSAGLLAILYGAVSATAGASGSIEAFKTQYASATASAGVSGSITPTKTQYAFIAGTAGADHYAAPTQTHAARSSASAGATGVAFTSGNIFATSGGDCGATGYAIPNSKLANVAGSCGASGTATPTLSQYVRSSVSATATGTAAGFRTHQPTVSATAGCIGRADWQYKASGTSIWRHDAHAWASAGGTLVVDETKYKVVTGNGFIATAECSAVARAYLECRARVSATCGATAAVEATKTAYATMTGTAGCTGAVAATYNHMARVSATGGATYSQTVNSVLRTLTGAATLDAGATGQATGTIYKFVASSVQCGVIGYATAYNTKMAQVNASASLTITANAFGNAGVHAPDDRTMTVPEDYRNMIIPFDDRTMRLAA
jgi:hypothetical protein